MHRLWGIEHAAADLSTRAHSRDPFAVAAACGIRVIPRRLPHTCGGLFAAPRGAPIIVLDPRASDARARWFCAHELGHWWWWRHALTEHDEESWCDMFAANLLAPRAHVLDTRGHTDHTLLAARARIPHAAAWLRYAECGVVNAAAVVSAYRTVYRTLTGPAIAGRALRRAIVTASVYTRFADEPDQVGALISV
jgi:Zn-dependent peptidase ImmA (M78 family)